MRKNYLKKYILIGILSGVSCSKGSDSSETACNQSDSNCLIQNLAAIDGTGEPLSVSYQTFNPSEKLELSNDVQITYMTGIFRLPSDKTPATFQFKWTSKQAIDSLYLCISFKDASTRACMTMAISPAAVQGTASIHLASGATITQSPSRKQINRQSTANFSLDGLDIMKLYLPDRALGITGYSETQSNETLWPTKQITVPESTNAVATSPAKILTDSQKLDVSLGDRLSSTLDKTYMATGGGFDSLAEITGASVSIFELVKEKKGTTQQAVDAVSALLDTCGRVIDGTASTEVTPAAAEARVATVTNVMPQAFEILTNSTSLTNALTRVTDIGTIISNQIAASQTPVPSAVASTFTPSSGGGGSSNTPWGTTGIVKKAVSSNDDTAYATALQSDNKVVITGNTNTDFFVARYNTDGSLDTTFDTDGIAIKDVSSDVDAANALAIQSDGKILVAGYANISSQKNLLVARYNSDGSLDTTFDTDGIYTYYPSSDCELNSILIQSDGKIVVGGTANSKFILARLTSTGSLDPTFGTSGIVSTDVFTDTYADDLQALALQSDGKIVAVGSAGNGSSLDTVLVRYNSNGTLDTASFNSGGGAAAVRTDVSSSNDDSASAVALNSDGTRIIIGGYKYNGTDNEATLLLYDNSGAAVNSFGSSGVVSFGTSGSSKEDEVRALKFTSDGYILAAGQIHNSTDSSSDSFVRKYDTSGALVTSLGSGGTVTTNIDSKENYTTSMALQSDGKIVLAGFWEAGSGNRDVAVIRLKSNGALDAQ